MRASDESTALTKANADLLIPGKGQPISNGAVVWQEGTIVYAGAQSALPARFKHVPVTSHQILMPGMWDCHIHFLGATSAMMQTFATTSQSLAGARSVPDLRDTLMAGFTSVREVGGYGCELAKAVNEGKIPGPAIYSAHSAISMTRGHADMHNVHLESFKDLCSHGLPFTIADGVDECIKAVRLQLRRGARVIKVCASGGVLTAIVEEAKRAHRLVAAHCHGKSGIMAALRAGCTRIEHGSSLDEEAADLMLQKGAVLVATRSIIEARLASPKLWSPGSYTKLQHVARSHMDAYALAVRKGVKIALGTDFFISSKGDFITYGQKRVRADLRNEGGHESSPGDLSRNREWPSHTGATSTSLRPTQTGL